VSARAALPRIDLGVIIAVVMPVVYVASPVVGERRGRRLGRHV